MERGHGVSRGPRGSGRRGSAAAIPAMPAATEPNPASLTSAFTQGESANFIAQSPHPIPSTSPSNISSSFVGSRGRSRSFNIAAGDSSAPHSISSPSRPARSERAAKPSQLPQSYTFPMATPSPAMAFKDLRSSTGDVVDFVNGRNETVSKGGHSLRRRKPKSYSNFADDEDPAYQTPEVSAETPRAPTAASTRGRKRKTIQELAEDDYDELALRDAKRARRGRLAQAAPSPSATRRRQPGRQPTALKQYSKTPTTSIVVVKDSIEVGVTFDDSPSEISLQSSPSQSESTGSARDVATAEQGHALAIEEVPETQTTIPTTVDHDLEVVDVTSEKDVSSPQPDLSIESEVAADDPIAPEPSPHEAGRPLGSLDAEETPFASQTLVASPHTITEVEDDASDQNESVADVGANKPEVEPTTPAMAISGELHATAASPAVVPVTSVSTAIKGTTEQVSEEMEEVGLAAPQPSAQPSPQGESPSRIMEDKILDRDSRNALVQMEYETVDLPVDKEPEAAVQPEQPEKYEQEEPTPPTPPRRPTRSSRRTASRLFEPMRSLTRKQSGALKVATSTDVLTTASLNQEITTLSPTEASILGRKPLIDAGHTSRPTGKAPAAVQLSSARETPVLIPEVSSPRRLGEADVETPAPTREVVDAPADVPRLQPWQYLSPFTSGHVFYPKLDNESANATPFAEVDDLAAEIEEAPAEDELDVQEFAQNLRGGSGTPPPEDTRPNSPLPHDGVEDAQEALQLVRATKQFRYKQLRDPKEFTAALKNPKAMSTEDLYAALAAANAALVEWQDEYNDVRKIVDDEDNAVRRRQQDAALETKTATALKKNNPAIDVLERDFTVKGIRARDTDPHSADKERQRAQDKLMSQIYFFNYDAKESMVGRQDPVAQREEIQNSRLRNRPKMTQKAAEAEADENLVLGKRPRRKRALSEEASPYPSRAGTPALQPQVGTTRRRRAPLKAIENGDAPVDRQPTPAPVVAPKKPPARRARGAKSLLSSAALTPQDFQTEEQATPEPQPLRSHKRRLNEGLETPIPPPTFEQHGARARTQQPELAAPAPKRPRINIINHNFNNFGRQEEMPSSSFYGNPSPTTEESRPSTAASSATEDTVDSNYTLRRKRGRNYKEESNIDPPIQPQRKRQRTTAASKRAPPAPTSRRTQPQTLAQGQHSFPIAPAPQLQLHSVGGQMALAPAPPMRAGSATAQGRTSKPFKIKSFTPVPVPPIVGAPPPPPPALAPAIPLQQTAIPIPRSGSSSRVATPVPVPLPLLPQGSQGLARGQSVGMEMGDDGEEKDYRQMTKSEKMSHSMKTRWANGSMTAAVAKRKATLAAKKLAAAQVVYTPASEGGEAGAAPSSAEATPVPTPGTQG